ncbi:helicase HerA domain-containing protein [Methylorubrum suomiense]
MLPTYRQAASPAPSGADDRIELGTALPDAATLDRLVAKWTEAVSDPYLPAAERLALTPLAFEAYCYAVEGRDKIARETRRREALTWQIEDTGKGVGTLHVLGEESPEVLAFLRFDRQSDDTPDLAGWLRYLRRKIPVEKLMERWPEFRPVAAFPEASRRMHTLVVAATGHGKSEVLKALLHPYAQRRRAGVLLIDPGRTLAVDVARWPELHRDNRIIYVEPELRAGLTVGFNPFDRAHLLDVREKATWRRPSARRSAK